MHCRHAKRFLALVNMSPAEIRAWARDPRARCGGFSATRARLPALAALRAKPVSAWTASDCARAARVVSFNARFEGMRAQFGCTTKINVGLRNWGRKGGGCPRVPENCARSRLR